MTAVTAMTAAYSRRRNDRAFGNAIFFLSMGSALGIFLMFSIAIPSLASIFSLTGHSPLPWPAEPAFANRTSPGFVPTLADCPPDGKCPRAVIMTHRNDVDAFSRYLQIVALNHGGDYFIDQGSRRNMVVTLQLPQAAARELQNMSRRGIPGWFFSPAVSPGYQQWAARWSEKRASTLFSAPDTLTTLTVFVQKDWRVAHYIGLIFFVAGAVSLATVFWLIYSCILKR